MRKPLVAGNWKMYKTISAAVALVREIAEGLRAGDPEVVVFPPATALHAVAQAVKGTPFQEPVDELLAAIRKEGTEPVRRSKRKARVAPRGAKKAA